MWYLVHLLFEIALKTVIVTRMVNQTKIVVGRTPISVAAVAIHFAVVMSSYENSYIIKAIVDVSGISVMGPHMTEILPPVKIHYI